jgi:transposase-like protein
VHTKQIQTAQIQTPIAGRRRGRYSEAFKAQVITAARQPGVSTAAVALANGLNANLLRRWISESDAPRPVTRSNTAAVTATAQPPFVALQVGPRKDSSEGLIHIELQRAGTTVRIQWPVSAARECAGWVREVLA